MRKPSAFSLIELSIVLLVIGIILVGITQSSRVVSEFRLNNARTQTQSSPVVAIDDLYLWLESTSKKSFDDGADYNDAKIINWYDINPQDASRFTFNQATDKSKPTYTTNSLNGLPVLSFDGGDYLESSVSFGITGNQDHTIFVVGRPTAGAWGPFLNFGGAATCTWLSFGRANDDDNNGKMFSGYYGGGQTYTHASLGTDSAYAIHVWVRDSGSGLNDGYTGNVVYVNGTSQTMVDNGTSCTPALTNTTALAGSDLLGNYLTGYIAEIIYFNRKLKTDERESVQDYLSKKWGITVS